MAPPNSQKRVKGVQIYRPFVFGTIAKPFDPVTNPKPESAPADHTHSWTVFVKGVDDTDITYWLKKVQFKLHESIPNPLRTVEAVPGQMFRVDETGWGEFEISIKLHYVSESLEKPQTLWHGLRLHPYGTEEEKAKQKENGCEVIAWCYEEQLFNEPYENFYDILTSGPEKGGRAKGGKKKMTGGMVSAGADRTALVPARASPGQPYSKETEQMEVKRLKEAQTKVDEQIRLLQKELKSKEASLASLRA
ncbi:MAG: NuA4 histone H4 acetyltransferase complex and the SWR1 complex subunit [Claussenomyces sp. TS43310]|nr:MAG: NuA4 histone H4 acetyltransferase complex and the SWR1 complex subunit [Claussenomyces sp. TS43310]